MKLSKRLQVIYSMVPFGVAADVGSDHGKLIITLFQDGKIEKGYAIENKKGPYDRLVKAIEQEGLLDDVVPLFSDGISDLPLCVDTVIIAGMGGLTIVEILKAHLSKLSHVDTIIVDAHNAIPVVRSEITKMGYIIADEKMVEEDGTYYEIIKFIKGEVKYYSKPEIEFGPILSAQKSALFRNKCQSRIKEIDNLLLHQLPEKRVIELKDEKQRIMNVL